MSKIRLLSILLVFVFLIGCTEQQMQPKAIFCPAQECEEMTAAAILSADNSIDVAMYSLTSETLAEALISAKANGIRVRVLLDKLQAASKSSQKEKLEDSGIEIRIFSGTMMHNKFAVIDNELIITGSYNWTKNASEKNKENEIFLQDKKIAGDYSEEFFNLWIESG